jgi:hypothetical protein
MALAFWRESAHTLKRLHLASIFPPSDSLRSIETQRNAFEHPDQDWRILGETKSDPGFLCQNEMVMAGDKDNLFREVEEVEQGELTIEARLARVEGKLSDVLSAVAFILTTQSGILETQKLILSIIQRPPGVALRLTIGKPIPQ